MSKTKIHLWIQSRRLVLGVFALIACTPVAAHALVDALNAIPSASAHSTHNMAPGAGHNPLGHSHGDKFYTVTANTLDITGGISKRRISASLREHEPSAGNYGGTKVNARWSYKRGLSAFSCKYTSGWSSQSAYTLDFSVVLDSTYNDGDYLCLKAYFDGGTHVVSKDHVLGGLEFPYSWIIAKDTNQQNKLNMLLRYRTSGPPHYANAVAKWDVIAHTSGLCGPRSFGHLQENGPSSSHSHVHHLGNGSEVCIRAKLTSPDPDLVIYRKYTIQGLSNPTPTIQNTVVRKTGAGNRVLTGHAEDTNGNRVLAVWLTKHVPNPGQCNNGTFNTLLATHNHISVSLLEAVGYGALSGSAGNDFNITLGNSYSSNGYVCLVAFPINTSNWRVSSSGARTYIATVRDITTVQEGVVNSNPEDIGNVPARLNHLLEDRGADPQNPLPASIIDRSLLGRYDVFPSVYDFKWSGSPNFDEYGASRDPHDQKETMESQTVGVVVAKNGIACVNRIDPYNPPSGLSSLTGICSPDIDLELLIPQGTDLNTDINFYVRDLCINGWDHPETDGTTSIRVGGQQLSFPGGDATGSKKGHFGCAAHSRDYAPGNNKEFMTAYANSDFSKLPDAAYEVVDGLKIPSGGLHLWEFYDVKLRDLTSDGETRIKEPGGLQRVFDKYRIEIRFTGSGRNVFTMGVGSEADHKIIYSSRGGVRNPRIISLSNNALYTNQESGGGYYHGLANHRWDGEIEITPPCELFEQFDQSGWQSHFDKLYKDYLGKDHATMDSEIYNVSEGYILAPIGFFDSDINYGDQIAQGETGHDLLVWEKARSDPDTAYTQLNLSPGGHGTDLHGNFNGLKNNEKNQDISGAKVAGNGVEAFFVKFKKNHTYRIKFDDIHYRNYAQFVLPFGQDYEKETCDDKPIEVEITPDCDLRILSLNWNNGHPNPKPEDVYINIVGKETGPGTDIFKYTDNTHWKIVTFRQKEIPVSEDVSNGELLELVPFKSSDPTVVSWLYLIDNNKVTVNQRHQAHLNGFYDNFGDLQHAGVNYPGSNHDGSIDWVQFEGHKEFWLERDGVGKYYFKVIEDDPANPVRIPDSGYCADSEFTIEIDEECDIYITKLNWERPQIGNPSMRVSWVGLSPYQLRKSYGGSSTDRIDQPINSKTSAPLASWRSSTGDASESTILNMLNGTASDGGRLYKNRPYRMQLTGYYKAINSTSTPDEVLTENENKDRLDGEVAAEIEIIDGNSPSEYRIRYRNHDPNLHPDWQDWVTMPTDPSEDCGRDNPPLEIEITEDCDLIVSQLDWLKTDNTEPEYVFLEIFKRSGGNSHNRVNYLSRETSVVDQTSKTNNGFKVLVNNSSDPSWTLLNWTDFESLITSNQMTPDRSNQGKYWLYLTGYHDSPPNSGLIRHPSTDIGTLPNHPLIGKINPAEGDNGFRLVQHNSGTGYSFLVTRRDGLGNPVTVSIPSDGTACSPALDKPKMTVEITNSCDVQINNLDWDGFVAPDGTTLSNSTHRFEVSLVKKDHGGVWRKIGHASTSKRLSASTPHTLIEFRNSTPATDSLLELLSTSGSGIEKDETYEIRITGYYDSGNNLVSLMPGFESIRQPRGKGIFFIKRFPAGGTNWKIYAADGSGDSLPHTPPTSGCLDGPGIPNLKVDIDNNCNIIVTELDWSSGDNQTHNLKVSIVGSGVNVGMRQISIGPPRGASQTLLQFDNVNPPYGSNLATGVTYQLFTTGYYDNLNGGRFTNFPSPLVSSYQASGDYAFRIDASTDPVTGAPRYHLVVNNSNRVPVSGYCYTGPCTPPNCPIADCSPASSVSNWNHRGSSDTYGVQSVIWYDRNRRSTDIVPASDVYLSYVTGDIRTAAGQTTFVQTPPPSPATFYVIPVANQPGQVIPGSSSITRNQIISDITNGFEYDFDDDRRDSVYTMFNQNYRPKTTVRWDRGAGSYGLSYNSGWTNSYNVRITPRSLDLMMPSPGSNVISTSRSYRSIDGRGYTLPNGNGFRVVGGSVGYTTSQNNYVDFETTSLRNNHNQQTQDPVPYQWNFYWDAEVTHRHDITYDKYDRREIRSWYQPWRWESYIVYVDDDGDPLTPTVPETRWRQVAWGSEVVLSTGSGGNYWYRRAHTWQYQRSTQNHSVTRKTVLTGTFHNCSWVLIVKPPHCRVRRRMFERDSEKRINTGSNPDPYNTSQEYEIFPPGKPNNFSSLDLINENIFNLTHTTWSRASLSPSTSNPAWRPRDNGNNLITTNLTGNVSGSQTIYGRPRTQATGERTTFSETLITPEWPGEYRLNWRIGWSVDPMSWPTSISHPSRAPAYSWRGTTPQNQTIPLCTDPIGGIWVYVSGKPPECSVDNPIFELSDPLTRLEIDLENKNWVDVWVPRISASAPQTYEAENGSGFRVNGVAEGKKINGSPPNPPNPLLNTTRVLLPKAPYAPNTYTASGAPEVTLLSDSKMADIPAPLGEYTYTWDVRVRLGIERWSTTSTGKQPNAWWDNPQERIEQVNPSPRTGNSRCEEIVKIVRIPFVKTFLGGVSAGGRFGLSDEFDSCDDGNNWMMIPDKPQAAWGHSVNTKSLNDAIGSSVEQSLRVQRDVGGIYSSSLTNQPSSHTNPNTVESKALTYANNAGVFGGGFNTSPGHDKGWRCIPNYWRIPDNANTRNPSGNPPPGIPGLSLIDSLNPAEGASNSTLGVGSGVDLKDGDVIYIDGNLDITGSLLPAGEEDLRASIFVKGDVVIGVDIENNTNPTKKYHGFSDMGLIQIIALGDIHVRPNVNRIDATLVAYPVYDDVRQQLTSGGSIDLCASQTISNINHYAACASVWDYGTGPATTTTDRKLTINGALVARRVYLNRLHETLQKNLGTGPPPSVANLEPTWATYQNTLASEVIVLMPEYHFVTPAASVFDDWIKRPQAVFDIPTSL